MNRRQELEAQIQENGRAAWTYYEVILLPLRAKIKKAEGDELLLLTLALLTHEQAYRILLAERNRLDEPLVAELNKLDTAS